LNSKLDYVLQIADNSVILAQRLGEWCGHGPVLEQDIALTNIALDVLGQARYLYQYAALIDDKGKTEDFYPFFRSEREFKNVLLVEQPNGDWAHTIVRQFYYDNFCQLFYTKLMQSNDPHLVAIASKAIKEVNYHLKFSSEWIIRMGDGTEESHNRVVSAVETLWEFTGELFEPSPYEKEMVLDGTGVDVTALRSDWLSRVNEVFSEAGLIVPQATWFQSGGKTGVHSEYLGIILAELQYIQKSMPGLQW